MPNDRPHVVRNLMAEFDALPERPAPVNGVPLEATPIDGVPAEATPVDGVPAEDTAERERVLAERVTEAERLRFAARWGYDVLLDKPVVGGGWEYEQIYPPPPPPPPPQEAVQEVQREP